MSHVPCLTHVCLLDVSHGIFSDGSDAGRVISAETRGFDTS
jgi:hypothetical protein